VTDDADSVEEKSADGKAVDEKSGGDPGDLKAPEPAAADPAFEGAESGNGVDESAGDDTAGDDTAGDDTADDDKAEVDPQANGDAAEEPVRRGRSMRLAITVGLAVTVAMAGSVGWLAYRAYQSHQQQDQRNVMIQAGRQAALNLTTISYEEVDADVQRVLGSATGSFYDDFQKRSPAFVEVVKQAKSKSVGNVTEAGLESGGGDQGQVLVAVSVHTNVAGVNEDRLRAWRMRISLQKTKDGVKVSNVEFVP
jgi:Mce-associated membrane protein